MAANSELTDIELAAQIRAADAAACDILVIVNAFTAVAAARAAGETLWRHIGDGEFGVESAKVARKAIKSNHLHWCEVTGSPNAHALDQASGSMISLAELDAWVKRAQGMTISGRGEMPAKKSWRAMPPMLPGDASFTAAARICIDTAPRGHETTRATSRISLLRRPKGRVARRSRSDYQPISTTSSCCAMNVTGWSTARRPIAFRRPSCRR